MYCILIFQNFIPFISGVWPRSHWTRQELGKARSWFLNCPSSGYLGFWVNVTGFWSRWIKSVTYLCLFHGRLMPQHFLLEGKTNLRVYKKPVRWHSVFYLLTEIFGKTKTVWKNSEKAIIQIQIVIDLKIFPHSLQFHGI